MRLARRLAVLALGIGLAAFVAFVILAEEPAPTGRVQAVAGHDRGGIFQAVTERDAHPALWIVARPLDHRGRLQRQPVAPSGNVLLKLRPGSYEVSMSRNGQACTFDLHPTKRVQVRRDRTTDAGYISC